MTAQGCPDRGVLEDACSVISSTGSGTAPAIPWSQQSECQDLGSPEPDYGGSTPSDPERVTVLWHLS